jgi:drug/metabolite transporter (DMT)-like permease
MIAIRKLSTYIKIGVLLAFLGLLVLGLEDVFLDESRLLTTLYLLPIGCFISSFIAFAISAKRDTK